MAAKKPAAKKPAAKKPAKKAEKVAKPMKKSDMIDAIVAKTGFTKKAVTETYAAIFDLVVEATKKGDFVLHGLGKFSVVQRKARMGRNPHTGEPQKIPAKKAVKFKVSKYVVKAVLGE